MNDAKIPQSKIKFVTHDDPRKLELLIEGIFHYTHRISAANASKDAFFNTVTS